MIGENSLCKECEAAHLYAGPAGINFSGAHITTMYILPRQQIG
jgi:hypothetical protein